MWDLKCRNCVFTFWGRTGILIARRQPFFHTFFTVYSSPMLNHFNLLLLTNKLISPKWNDQIIHRILMAGHQITPQSETQVHYGCQLASWLPGDNHFFHTFFYSVLYSSAKSLQLAATDKQMNLTQMKWSNYI